MLLLCFLFKYDVGLGQEEQCTDAYPPTHEPPYHMSGMVTNFILLMLFTVLDNLKSVF